MVTLPSRSGEIAVRWVTAGPARTPAGARRYGILVYKMIGSDMAASLGQY